jgi:hypothetical protein
MLSTDIPPEARDDGCIRRDVEGFGHPDLFDDARLESDCTREPAASSCPLLLFFKVSV